MAAPSLTYSLTNGSTADASQVMQNFNDLLNGITDGTKDLSISALTCAGTASLNGHVNLGNSSADDLIILASLAGSIPIKTTNSYDIGSSTLGLRALYFGANSQTVNVKASSSMSATWTMTLPVTAGTSGYLLQTDGAGVTSWVQGISYGTYTPTPTLSTNVTACTLNDAQYMRVGTVVTVAGTGTVDASSGSTFSTFGISFPIASDISQTYQVGGTFTIESTGADGYTPGFIFGSTAGDRATLRFQSSATDVSNLGFSYIFTYRVI
jgi:hypothetical protein